MQDSHRKLNGFRVNSRGIGTNSFRANLEELSITALLGTFAAEHRADVIELLQARLLIEAVLHISAQHRCRIFRPQGE